MTNKLLTIILLLGATGLAFSQYSFHIQGVRPRTLEGINNTVRRSQSKDVISGDSLVFKQIFRDSIEVAPGQITEISVVNVDLNMNIWVGTINDCLWKSSDLGYTWVHIDTSKGFDGSQVWGITTTNSGAVIAATSPYGGYRSFDAGRSWDTLDGKPGLPDYIEWGFSVLADQGTGLLLGTEEDGVYRSTDNGETWSSSNQGIPYPDIFSGRFSPVYSLIRSSEEEVYGLTGFNGDTSDLENHVVKSTDDGIHWQEIDNRIPQGRTHVILQRSPTSGSLFVSCGETYRPVTYYGGAVYRSSDNGNNWGVVVDSISGGLFPSIAINSKGQIYVGSEGGILRSLDDGLTWSKVSSLQPWTFMTFDSAGYLYLAYGSKLYKSVSKAVTTVAANQAKPHSRFLLNANYPNPFNPSTLILFSTTREGPVTLRIYDILGREVATLVNENRKPGEYTERFDGGRIASGVYIYVLRSSEGQLVGRMILLK